MITFLKKFNYIKFRFDFPKSKPILQFDELNSGFLKKAIKKDFNIMPRHTIEIYFWIFIKQIILFDFSFLTYFKNYVKFTSTKIVITTIDNNLSYYELKNSLKKVIFISIQNGVRQKNTYFFQKRFIKKNSKNLKDLKCDHFFVFNKYIIKEYKKIIESNYHVLGNYKNNYIEIKKTRFRKSFLFIALGAHGKTSNLNSMRIGLSHHLLKLFAIYFSNSNKKLNILLKNKDHEGQKKEIEFYKKFFKSNCIFLKTSNDKKERSTEIVDKFENIIFTDSTLGYEAISRKKKVAIFPVNKNKIDQSVFGWPKEHRKEYNFFTARKLNYGEIKRVLDNVYNCKQENWEKKHYKNIKDLMYFDKNNSKLRKVVNTILKNSINKNL